jgi:hypothetical protein
MSELRSNLPLVLRLDDAMAQACKRQEEYVALVEEYRRTNIRPPRLDKAKTAARAAIARVELLSAALRDAGFTTSIRVNTKLHEFEVMLVDEPKAAQ